MIWSLVLYGFVVRTSDDCLRFAGNVILAKVFPCGMNTLNYDTSVQMHSANFRSLVAGCVRI